MRLLAVLLIVAVNVCLVKVIAGVVVAVLKDAEQSTTGNQGLAELAIDGDSATYSETDWVKEKHWWSASFTNKLTVSQIILTAASYKSEEIKALLFNGGKQTGSCGEHSGGQTKKEQILDCQDEVMADKIELSFTSDSDTWLRVYEIKAKGVLLVQGL